MHTNVVIVGGGLSGVALAHALKKSRTDFILLEARDRLGGRILSPSSKARVSEFDNYDLGPSWFWPGQPRIAALIREFGIEIFQQYDKGRLVYQDTDGSVQDTYSFSRMAGSLRIAGGAKRIIEVLAECLDERVLHLSHVVTSVNQLKHGFEVAVDGPGGIISITANTVVFAVPPRVVLNQIIFSPALDTKVARELSFIPTWMAGHAKLVAVYNKPFWRDHGLSGDGISRAGPLMQIHDASPVGAKTGALFGFVGLPLGSPERERSRLIESGVEQLSSMFGREAARPLDVFVKDWASDQFTSTKDDTAANPQPLQGMTDGMRELAAKGLIFGSTEVAPHSGGLLEGALEASEYCFNIIQQRNGRL